MRICTARVRSIVFAAAAASSLSLFHSTASATDFTWIPTAGGAYDWGTGTNWNPAGPPNSNSDSATLSIGMTGNQTISLNAPFSVATISLGSTAAAITTDIANAGAGLLIINGGSGTASLVSTGVAGVTNRFSVPVQLQSNLDISSSSTQPVQFTGGISAFGGNRVVNNSSPIPLTISGNVPIVDPTDTASRAITFNDQNVGGGNVTLAGVISDGAVGFAGGLNIGRSANEASPYTRVVITGNNTYTGTTNIRRAIVVVGSNTAFGTSGLVTLTGATGQMMATLESDDDARTIGTTLGTRFNQFAIIQGNHSLTFTTKVAQGNNRSLSNFLIPGKTLTFNSDIYGGTDNTNRTWVFEGPGRTIVNGNMFRSDQSQGPLSTAVINYEKRGTGMVTVNSTASDYNGGTRVRSGLLEFAVIGGMGATTGATVEAGGAMGLLTGSTNPAFLTLLSTGGGAGPSQDPTSSHGALALAPSDAAVGLDFSAGNMSAANLRNMGIGAVSSGVTYTGTIVPANSTYKLGGGGDLTLPGAAQLTGANGVTADNGGKVIISGLNDYSGVTKIGGNYVNPSQMLVQAGAGTSLITTPFSLRVNSTLSTSILANGNASSGIGAAASAASNVVIDGGTLQYTGGATSTDHLFSIGANGATLDASGSGAVNFANAGNVVSADAPDGRSGTIDTNGRVLYLTDVSDLAPGMTISGGGVAAGTTIAALMAPSFGNIGNTGGNGPYQIILSQVGTAGAAGPLGFGNQNRTLNLTGTNTGNNTIAGVLSDSITGKLAVAKSGAGRWVLGGNNTFTGGTTVSGGVLEFSTKIPNGPVTISGGTLKVTAKGTPNSPSGTSVVPSLTITGSTLDLTNNSMVIDYTDPVGTLVSDVRGYLRNGKMITSSGTATTRLGYADNAVLGKTTFAGVSVDTSSVLIKYTYAGDADLDGDADGVDIGTWATNFTGELGGNGSAVWTQGDWDYDGDVDGVDAGLWAQAFTGELGGAGLGSLVIDDPNIAPAAAAILRGLGVTVVPEPAVGLLAFGLVGLLGRRHSAHR